MWTAFPSSDYYEDSVTMPGKLVQFRQSPVTVATGNKDSRIRFRFFITVLSRLLRTLLTAHPAWRYRDGKYAAGFRAVTHARIKRELEPYVRQYQPYPHIFLSSGFSRTKCPLGDLSIPRHAMFPWRFPLAVRRDDWRAVVRRGSPNHF